MNVLTHRTNITNKLYVPILRRYLFICNLWKIIFLGEINVLGAKGNPVLMLPESVGKPWRGIDLRDTKSRSNIIRFLKKYHLIKIVFCNVHDKANKN